MTAEGVMDCLPRCPWKPRAGASRWKHPGRRKGAPRRALSPAVLGFQALRTKHRAEAGPGAGPRAVVAGQRPGARGVERAGVPRGLAPATAVLSPRTGIAAKAGAGRAALLTCLHLHAAVPSDPRGPTFRGLQTRPATRRRTFHLPAQGGHCLPGLHRDANPSVAEAAARGGGQRAPRGEEVRQPGLGTAGRAPLPERRGKLLSASVPFPPIPAALSWQAEDTQ